MRACILWLVNNDGCPRIYKEWDNVVYLRVYVTKMIKCAFFLINWFSSKVSLNSSVSKCTQVHNLGDTYTRYSLFNVYCMQWRIAGNAAGDEILKTDRSFP